MSWEGFPWKRVRLGIHAGKDLLLAPNQPETASEKLFLGINAFFFLGFSTENVGSPTAFGSRFGEGWVFLRGI